MLEILRLEGTDNAITSEQAKTLLPLLQSLQGQAKADAERNAVWANIEKQLTSVQLSAIVNMQLTQNDLQTWTQNNNQGPGAGPMPGGPAPQGKPGAGPAHFTFADADQTLVSLAGPLSSYTERKSNRCIGIEALAKVRGSPSASG